MTILETRLDRALGAILYYGCPICGETEGSLVIEPSGSIRLDPCGHVVSPDDALHMDQLQRDLDKLEPEV